jgi:TetR/AcrR family transcriptional repressor of nem operon
MGMAKKYDRAELLDRAVELFRRQGYNGTSTADLVTELGVNRKSMYAEFGSKQQLFEAVLEHYNENQLSEVLSSLEAPGASLVAIRQAFRGYAASSEGRMRGLGCLMCNTAVERASLDPGSKRFVNQYLKRIAAAFRSALDNAKQNGEIDTSINLDTLAGFFTTLLLGIAASVRAEAAPDQVWAAYEVVLTTVDGLLS